MLEGKKILIGVTGSIAAYKVASLVRLLKKQEAEVNIVMTSASLSFITPVTLSTLSENPVHSEFYDKSDGTWNNHVDLALWADLMVIAPATAGTLSKMANGNCDNLLLATYLSAKCDVMFAPAMDLDMFQHESTKINIEKLKSFGNVMIQPGVGELASGLVGEGRMAEPEIIVEAIQNQLTEKTLLNKKVLVNAGPTYESIDPVRFIGNHSSGKMGIAIAEEFARRGAEVKLVLGPTDLRPSSNINTIDVISAEEMFDASVQAFSDCQVAVLASAVADYTPKHKSEQKIKKEEGTPSIELERTKDILLHLGTNKSESQVVVGFAMETENEIENAKSKVKKKNADFIVLNSLRTKDAGFKSDSNQVTFVNNKLETKSFELKSKTQVAVDIVNEIELLLK